MYTIRKMGCDGMHDNHFSINRPQGYDCYLLLIIKTAAQIEIHDNCIETKPGTLLLYAPGTPHKYRAADKIYQNDWMQFEAGENLNIHHQLPLNTPVFIGNHSVYEKYFSLIGAEFFGNSPLRDYLLSNLMNVFLSKISALNSKKEWQNENAYASQLLKLRQSIYNFPEKKWSIPEIAASLSLSSGYFHLLYKNAFGITCHRDVILSRLDRAKELLAFSSQTVRQVASQCGYETEEHFMRQFRKHMNMTPSAYRAEHGTKQEKS